MIYLFDKDEKLVKIVRKTAVKSALQKFALTTDNYVSDRLTVELKALSESETEVIEYMAIQSIEDDHKFHYFYIAQKQDKGDILELVGVQSGIEELRKLLVYDKKPRETEAKPVITDLLNGSNWKARYIATTPVKNTNFYYLTIFEALQKVCRVWGLEMQFFVEMNGNKIGARYIDFKKKIGEAVGKRVVYGHNALEILQEVERTNIFTALVGRGKGEEVSSAEENESGQAGYGRKITFEEVEWKQSKGDPLDKPLGQKWLELPDMTQRYGVKDASGGMRPKFGIVEFSEEEDPSALLQSTYEALIDASRPQVTFKTSAVYLKNVSIGDTIRVVRHDKGLDYETRIFEITFNRLNNHASEIKLGDRIADNNSVKAQAKAYAEKAVEEFVSSDFAKFVESLPDYIQSADGFNTNWYSEEDPTVKYPGKVFINDIWYKPDPEHEGHTVMLRWTGEVWEEILRTYDSEALGDRIAEEIQNVNDQMAQNEAERDKEVADLYKKAGITESLFQEAKKKAEEAEELAEEALTKAQEVKEKAAEDKLTLTDKLIAIEAKAEADKTNFDDSIKTLEGKATSLRSEVDTARSTLINHAEKLSEQEQELIRQGRELTSQGQELQDKSLELTQQINQHSQTIQQQGQSLEQQGQLLQSQGQSLERQAQQITDQAKAQTGLTQRVSTVETTANGTKQSVSELTKTVNKQTGDISTVTQKTKTIEADLTNTKTTLSETKNELATAKNSLNTLSSRTKTVEDSLDGTKTTLTAVQKTLDTTNNSVKSLTNRTKTVEDDIKGTKTTLSEVQEGLTGANNSIKSLSSRTKVVEDDLNGTKTTINEVKQDIAGANNNIKSLSSRTKTVEDDLNGTKTSLSEVKTTLNGTNNTVKNLSARTKTVEDDVKGTKTKLTEVTTGLATTNSALETTNSNLAKANQNLTTLSSRTKTVEDDVKGTKTTLSEVQRGLTAANSSISSLTSRTKTVEDDVKGTKTKLTEVTTGLATTNANLTATNNSLATTNANLTTTNNNLAKANQSITTLTSRTKTVEDDVKGTKTKLTEVTTGLATTNANLTTTNNNLAKANQSITTLTSRTKTFEDTIQGTKTTLNEVKQTLDGTNNTVKSLSNRTKTVEDDLSGTKTTLNEVKTGLSGASNDIKTLSNRTKTVEEGLNGTKTKLNSVEQVANTATGNITKLTSKTAELESGINGINNKFQNLRVGNRNYFKNSKSRSYTVDSRTTQDYQTYIYPEFWKNEARKKPNFVRVSFDIAFSPALENDFATKSHFSASPWYYSHVTFKGGTEERQHFDLVFDLQNSSDTYYTDNVFIRFTDTIPRGTKVSIDNMMLYLSDVFEDYVEADEAMSEKVAEYKQTAERNLASLTSTVEALDGTVRQNKTSIEQTANGLATRMTSLETYKNGESDRAKSYFEASKAETAKQISTERTAISQNYVAKSSYNEDVTGITRRLTSTETLVETANSTASSAQSSANSAVTKANQAQTTANSATSTANTAKTTADSATTKANSAQSVANQAKTTADSASAKATQAQSTATSADTKASTAQSTANTAKTTAEGAVSTANTANTKAGQAQTTASSAVSTANTAKTTADQAKTTATTAQSTANTAKTTADGASTKATQAQNTANTAKSTADNAKATADQVKTTVETVRTNLANYQQTTTQSLSDLTTRLSSTDGKITEANSKIDQTATAIRQEVSQVESKIPTSIGTRNLLRNTSELPTNKQRHLGGWGALSGGNGSVKILDADITQADIHKMVRIEGNTSGNKDFGQYVSLKIGERYTVSCWARVASDSSSSSVNLLVRSWTNNANNRTLLKSITNTEWERYSLTFTADAATNSIQFGQNNAGTIEICGMKLELGTVNSDWTPAPEDLIEEVSEVRSLIEQTKEGVKVFATKTEVQTVQNAVNTAQSTANTAKTTADQAKTTADTANTKAGQAQTTANTAKTTAEGAVSTANTAKTTATSAQTTATSAVNTANTAKTTADTAKTTANSAKTTAENAGNRANAANTNASNAMTEAAAAKTQSSNAVTIANGAKTTADNASTKAMQAQTKAESADSKASTATTTANTAKTTADQAKSTATTAQSTANTAKTTAEGAVSTANTAKTTANTAKTTADNALKKANDNAKLITTHTASLEVLNEKIESKVEKTVTDELGNRISTAESTIQTHAGQINQRLTSSQVEQAISAKGFQTKSQVDTNITGRGFQTKSQVDTNITGRGYQTKSQVDTNITGRGYQTKSQVDTNITGRGYITEAQANTKLSNYVTLTTLENKVTETTDSFSREITALRKEIPSDLNLAANITTEFNKLKDTVNAHSRTIGKVGTMGTILDGISRVTQTADGLVSEIQGSNGVKSQVAQLKDSWAVKNLTSSGTVLNQLNLNKDGSVKIDGKLVQITGNTYIQNGVITSAKIASLDAGKITTGSLDASKVNVVNLNASKITGLDANFIKGKIDSLLTEWLKGKVISSQNGATQFNLQNGQLNFRSSEAAIRRVDSNYPTHFIKFYNGTREGVRTSTTIIGANRDGGENHNSGSFTGLRIWAGGSDATNNVVDKVDLIADDILFTHIAGDNFDRRGWRMDVYGGGEGHLKFMPNGNFGKAGVYANEFRVFFNDNSLHWWDAARAIKELRNCFQHIVNAGFSDDAFRAIRSQLGDGQLYVMTTRN